VIDWVVVPLDHVLPVALDEVNVTDPPEQKVAEPMTVIVGVVGTGFTVTTLGVEDELHVPLDTVTL
jgi:hypothetical protein